jgi:hypothetical protein
MDSHLELKETNAAGEFRCLVIGGSNSGWFVDDQGQRIREATEEELEAFKKRFWGLT